MASLTKELVFLVLQFLDEEKLEDTMHKLEQESGFFFNVKYFEEKVLAGEWDHVEKYLFGFTKVDDNRYSMMIFFEIRKQKYLEALDRRDRVRAVEILVNDLKVFQSFNEYLFKEITNLLTLNNFRENEQLSKYGDTTSARNILLVELKRLIEANPLFRDKLAFPPFKSSRLRTLINQSLNWQHQMCKNPMTNPDIKSLLINHSCSPASGSNVPTPVNLPMTPVVNPSPYASLGSHVAVSIHIIPTASNVNALARWAVNANASTSSQLPSQSPVGATSGPQNQVVLDGLNNDQEQLMKQLRATQPAVEVTHHAPPEQASGLDDLPRIVVYALQLGSSITSMDFHPVHHSLLLGRLK
ncbi:unnamed protein product [Sphenostylis stenocarpa]|uniref:CTLH domain-containing protein n=1 Tax=Sphenostylis stenocarpa TaxID=92480 RepID=A0AA86SSH1_9FABA|nr:unnamed protein product [Sphenostylis stenocarpa]